MKTTKNSIIADLQLLIDVSCVDTSDLKLFEQFHKMLIRMSYKGTDVVIDYSRKRVYMNVLTEDESYDAVLANKFADTISVNLVYQDLNVFLKSCILEDTERLQLYYPFLTSHFFRNNSEKEVSESLETVL